MANYANFAKAALATSYGASAVSIQLAAGKGSIFPAAPFNATWWNVTDYPDPSDDPFVEIITVTAKVGDVLTVTRGAEGTNATSKNLAGKTYVVSQTVTAAVLASVVGGGNVTGPVGSTTGNIPLFNNTTGTLLSDSGVPSARLATFGASGAGHSAGTVPDPGVTSGTTKYLREDSTWQVPPGGSPPTGTGFPHITGGSQDAAARAVDVSTADVTGTLAAARFPALTGDVTTTAGSVATTIGSGKVTNSMLAQASANTIKGNNTGAVGTVVDMTTAQAKTLLAISNADVSGLGTLATASSVSLTTQATGTLQAAQAPALTGDVTTTAGSLATTIAAGAVTLAKQANLAANSIQGNNTGTPATPIALTAAQTKTLLAITNADVSGLGSLATASSVNLSTQATGTLQAAQEPAHTGDVTNTAGSLAMTIAASAVTNAKQANMAAGTVKGNNTGSAAAPIDLTSAQVAAMLPAFVASGASHAQGLVPDPGVTAGTTKFLREDSSWAVPSAGGSVPTGTGFTHITAGVQDGAAKTVDVSGADCTGTLAAARFPALTGDVTTSAGAVATTIAANAVTNAKAAQMAANTIKGNNTGATANAADLTAAQVAAILPAFVASGASHAQGLVPDPGVTAGTTKFLREDSTWQVPSGGGSTPTGTGFTHITAGAQDAAAKTVDVSGADCTGTLAAARFPALTGDVTTTAGALGTTIAAGAVTLAKQANLAANSIQGNNTGVAATPIALTVAQTKTLLAITNADVSGLGTLATASSVSLTTQATGTLQAAQAGALTGDVTSSAGSFATTVAVGAVTDAKAASSIKPQSRAVSTANVASLTGTTTVDGVSLVAGDLVLLTAQTTASQNGPWTISAGAWTRPNWYPAAGTVQAFANAEFSVREGTSNAGSIWYITTAGAITIDTTGVAFSQRKLVISGTSTQGVTGSGNVVLATSPTLVTPALGTPSSGTLTSCSGLPAATGLTGTLAAANMPALTGDVTTTAGAVATTIAANAVTNAKAAQMGANTIKGNNTGATANAADLTAAQVATMLPQFGASQAGVVPLLGGFATAQYYLRGDSTCSVPMLPEIKACSTANVASLSGTTTIDGTALVAGDSVLLTAQTTASQNGPWLIAAGAWTRPYWYGAGNVEMAFFGRLFAVLTGTTKGGTFWYISTTGGITIDTTAIALTQLPISATAAPGGSTTQVQFNNAGAMAGSTGAVIDASSNLVIASEYGTTTSPSAPTTGAVFYTSKRGGKRLMAYRDAISNPRALQNHIGLYNAKFMRPAGNSTTANTFGLAGLTTGTATAAAFATTTFRQTCNRIMYASVATAGGSCGFGSSSQQYHIGATAGWGGFYGAFQFAFPVQQTTWRFAVGFFNTNAALTNVNPSTNTHMACVLMDSSDTDVRFATNAAATATLSATGFGATIGTGDVFEYRIFCPPAGTTIYMGFGRITPGTETWVEYSTSSTLPTNTNFLAPQIWMNNGTTAAAVNVEVMKYYIESDF